MYTDEYLVWEYGSPVSSYVTVEAMEFSDAVEFVANEAGAEHADGIIYAVQCADGGNIYYHVMARIVGTDVVESVFVGNEVSKCVDYLSPIDVSMSK